MFKTMRLSVLMTALLLGVAASANAGPILGNQVEGQYYFPDDVTLYGNFSYSVNPFIIGAGIESVLTVDVSNMNIDFSDDSLVITFLQSVFMNAASFNGPQFLVLAGNPFDPVTSVIASGGQTVLADILSGVLRVNWQDQLFTTGDTVTVTFAAIPEPATLLLISTGLVAAISARRRSRNRS